MLYMMAYPDSILALTYLLVCHVLCRFIFANLPQSWTAVIVQEIGTHIIPFYAREIKEESRWCVK